MKKRIFVFVLFPLVVSAFLVWVVGIGIIGGGAAWLGIKAWSKIMSVQMKRNADKPADVENRLAANSVAAPSSPAPEVSLLASPVEETVRTSGPMGIILGVEAIPGGIEVRIPGPCQVDWSPDLQSWFYWRTYDEATNEQFETLGDALFFRAKTVRP